MTGSENNEPKLAMPNKDASQPNLVKLRIEKVEPAFNKSSNVKDVPSLAELRSDMDELK